MRASASTRRALAAVAGFADALQLRQFAARIAVAAIFLAAAWWSAASRTWAPMSLAAAILLVPLILKWLRAALRRQTRAAVEAARHEPDFDAPTFCQLIELLPLDPSTAYLLRQDCQPPRRNEYSS
jgi:hypothetical protein